MRALAMSLLVAAGCGHTMMRGSVVMKATDTEAHVCLGRGEVAVGDVVDVIHNYCQSAGTPIGDCKRQLLGRGVVEQVFDDHYSLVRFPAGLAFEEGDTIERAQ